MSRDNIKLPAGWQLSIVTNSTTLGTYARVRDGNYGQSDYPTNLSAGSTVLLGPYSEERTYEIIGFNGSPTITSEPFVLEGLTSSVTELNYVDNVTSAIQTQLNSKESTIVTNNIGAAASGVTAVERGDAYQHTTILTVNKALPAITGGGNEAEGILLYTLPAGACIIKQAYMSLAITQTQGNINADTPDVGLGTLQATGNQALLSALGAEYEDIITGQTAADCNGTATVKTIANQIKVIESAGAHTIYFNVADSWAASGDAAALVTGTVVLHWQFMA